MARYTRLPIGDKIAGMFNTVYGASEAPRVHGINQSRYDTAPRFKNHFFVYFQMAVNPNPPLSLDDMNSVMYRVKSFDAPKYTIELE